MKRFLFMVLVGLCLGITTTSANEPQKHTPISRKEFRARQAAFLGEKAQLTTEEASAFFPVYFELQDKKKDINEEIRKKIRTCKNQELTDKDYEEMVDLWIQVRERQNDLEYEYAKRFKKILPAKKLFNLMHAEMRFHRNMMKIMHNKKGYGKNGKRNWN